MLDSYRAVFRRPGSAAFCAAAFVMRMPIAIYPIGIVLIISARNGHYGFGGVLSACYVLGSAIGSPLLSVLVDRYGQRRVILPASAVHCAGVLALALLLHADAPDAALIAPALLFGFSYLPVGSLVRARWTHVLDGGQELATALSLESVLDEAIFVFGPLIATLLATHAAPTLVLYLGLVLVAGGSLWLAALHATEPTPHPRDDTPHGSALRAPGMVVLTVSTVAMGTVFASAEVAMVAYCGQHGERGLSGVVLAGIAAGSGISGLVYGSVAWRSSVLHRFRLQSVVFGLLPFVLLAGVNVPVLALCGMVLGLGIAPTLITSFGLIQQVVPARSLTEGLSWLTTGLSVGYGAGAALVGRIADQHGARTAFWVVIGAGLVVGVLGQVLHARLSARAPQPAVVGAGCDD